MQTDTLGVGDDWGRLVGRVGRTWRGGGTGDWSLGAYVSRKGERARVFRGYSSLEVCVCVGGGGGEEKGHFGGLWMVFDI